MPKDYTQATNAWVSETIVGIDMGINGPYAYSANNVGSGTVFNVMAAGLGSSDNAVDLALAYGDLNAIKAFWLAGSSPSYQSTSDRATKIQIRNVSYTLDPSCFRWRVNADHRSNSTRPQEHSPISEQRQ
jgi:hypothetical protein